MQIINRKAADKCIFLDMGHGGIDPKNGSYTTAPSKQYNHSGKSFNNGGWIYEGVKNRDYGLLMWEKMIKKNIHVVPVCHAWQDTPLQVRTNTANAYHQTVQKGIYLSEHSNAITGPTNPINRNARGMSVWTAPGQSHSDILAEGFVKIFKSKFFDSTLTEIKHDKINLLVDMKDGDSDYENGFHVLVMTQMPAILLENLFFDQIQDAHILFDTDYMESYTDVVAEWAEWAVRL